jgi:lipoprotein-releasing system permease protein
VYQSLLTRRYLTSKIMPWLAMLSVAVCCMITLVVWSIMGGFLDVFKDIGRKMEGDVSISWPTVGFGYYEDLIARLEKDPMVAGAAPVIRTYGMVSLPDDRAVAATIQGVDERYAKIGNYEEAIWWRPMTEAVHSDVVGKEFLKLSHSGDANWRRKFDEFMMSLPPKDRAMDPRLDPNWPQRTERTLRETPFLDDGRPVEPPVPGSFRSWEQMLEDGRRLMVRDPRTGEERPAAALGIELGGFSQRQPGGWYKAPQFVASRRADGQNMWSSAFLPSRSVTITVLPMDKTGRDISTRSLKLPVANEFRTGFFDTDSKTMVVHLSVLQKLLKMEAGEVVQSGGGKSNPYAIEGEGQNEHAPEEAVVRTEPAKVTTVLVRAKPGVTSEALRDRAIEIYAQFARDHAGQVPASEQLETAHGISTWERSFAVFIGQVEKETVTILLMLLLVSLVCTVLILSIFWSMVNEKTKDIGILRSVGCSRSGVAWVWIRYGVIIGIVGAVCGLAAGTAIVWNINPIHEWLGRAMGIQVWDPSVYYLPEIPSKVRPDVLAKVGICALVLSVLGALVPAVRAANMDPVRALRFE